MLPIHRFLLAVAGLLGTALLLNEEKKPETKSATPPMPVPKLRRGDRFTCPETGLELQVRHVGGRPRKYG